MNSSDGMRTLLAHRDWCSELKRMGTCDRAQSVTRVRYPRRDVPVIEAKGHLHSDRNSASQTADNSHDVNLLMSFSDWHEIDYHHNSAVSETNSFSRTSVGPRYRRWLVRTRLLGASSRRPFAGVPRSAAKQAPESNRGMQSQSIEPLFPTSGEVRVFPSNA